MTPRWVAKGILNYSNTTQVTEVNQAVVISNQCYNLEGSYFKIIVNSVSDKAIIKIIINFTFIFLIVKLKVCKMFLGIFSLKSIEDSFSKSCSNDHVTLTVRSNQAPNCNDSRLSCHLSSNSAAWPIAHPPRNKPTCVTRVTRVTSRHNLFHGKIHTN